MTGPDAIDDPVLRVRLEAPSLAELRAATDELEADTGCRPVAKRTDAGYRVDVLVPASRVESARARRSGAGAQVSMTVVQNETEAGRERLAEVDTGNRFARRGDVPRGLARKE